MSIKYASIIFTLLLLLIVIAVLGTAFPYKLDSLVIVAAPVLIVISFLFTSGGLDEGKGRWLRGFAVLAFLVSVLSSLYFYIFGDAQSFITAYMVWLFACIGCVIFYFLLVLVAFVQNLIGNRA